MTLRQQPNSLPQQADTEHASSELLIANSNKDDGNGPKPMLHQSFEIQEEVEVVRPQVTDEFNGDGRHRKTWSWGPVLLVLGVVEFLILVALSVAIIWLVHQQQQQQQLVGLSTAAATANPPSQRHRKTGQLASLILDTGAAPNCAAGNDRRLQPCWQHYATDGVDHKTYMTTGKLGRLQFSRDHVASPVFSLTPDGTGVKVNRGGTFAIDAQFRLEPSSRAPGVHGGVQVGGSVKFACSEWATVPGQPVICKVVTFTELHPGDTISMGLVYELHEPVQLFPSDIGTYIRIVYVG